MIRSFGLFSALVVVVSLSGCTEAGPETYPVTGKVTIGGEPASGLKIMFNPLEAGKEPAGGDIGADGSYTLYTGVEGKEGAPPGKYKITLSDPGDQSYMDPSAGGGDPTKAEGGKVPKEYKTAAESPKEVEVTAGPNTINIEI
jgi:hypothetical protein